MADGRRPLRLDDLGASSKQYERWSRHRWANVWPLHDRRLFGAMGPYRELTARELDVIFRIVHAAQAQITVAITANWVERDGRVVPYTWKYPEQAEMIRAWVGLPSRTVIPAIHGRTHCMVGQHRPRWIGGNRRWHREPPTDKIIYAIERERVECWLGQPVTRFVMPGQIAAPNDPEIVFHDREFVIDWTGAMRRLHEALT